MTKLTPEQRELLDTWPKLLFKQCEDLIDGSNVMIADINIFVKALLEAKDAEKAEAVEKERERYEKELRIADARWKRAEYDLEQVQNEEGL